MKGTSPSGRFDDYAGTYSNPAYGEFSTAVERDRLLWAHHGFVGSLEHFRYDTFVIMGNPEANGIADKDVS